MSWRITCTATELPVGTSDTCTQPPEKYAALGEETVPRTYVSELVTCKSSTFSPRLTTAAR